MKKERKVNMILAIVLWLICIAMFLPMVFVIINSFKTFGQVVMEPLALPEEWNLDNFKEVMKTGNYLKVFGNTIYFAVVSGVIVIALGAMAGYTGVPPSDVEKFKTHGFHYQWGRKDPYPSSYSNKPITEVTLPSPIEEPIVGIMSLYRPDGVKFLPFDPGVDATATYRTAYQNPLNIYKQKDVHKWITDRDNAYINAWNSPKTVHDPCPAGWRVAQIENYLSLFSNADQAVKGEGHGANVQNSNTLGKDGGMVLAYDKNKQKTTYVRFTGYYYLNTQFYYIGTAALIWCGNKLANSDKGESVSYFRITSTASTKADIVLSGHEREAIPLRCIQEKD